MNYRLLLTPKAFRTNEAQKLYRGGLSKRTETQSYSLTGALRRHYGSLFISLQPGILTPTEPRSSSMDRMLTSSPRLTVCVARIQGHKRTSCALACFSLLLQKDIVSACGIKSLRVNYLD